MLNQYNLSSFGAFASASTAKLALTGVSYASNTPLPNNIQELDIFRFVHLLLSKKHYAIHYTLYAEYKRRMDVYTKELIDRREIKRKKIDRVFRIVILASIWLGIVGQILIAILLK